MAHVQLGLALALRPRKLRLRRHHRHLPSPSSSSSSSSPSGSCRRMTSAATDRSGGSESGHSECIFLMSNATPRSFWQTQAFPMPRREERSNASAESILMRYLNAETLGWGWGVHSCQDQLSQAESRQAGISNHPNFGSIRGGSFWREMSPHSPECDACGRGILRLTRHPGCARR